MKAQGLLILHSTIMYLASCKTTNVIIDASFDCGYEDSFAKISLLEEDLLGFDDFIEGREWIQLGYGTFPLKKNRKFSSWSSNPNPKRETVSFNVPSFDRFTPSFEFHIVIEHNCTRSGLQTITRSKKLDNPTIILGQPTTKQKKCQVSDEFCYYMVKLDFDPFVLVDNICAESWSC